MTPKLRPRRRSPGPEMTLSLQAELERRKIVVELKKKNEQELQSLLESRTGTGG